MAKDNVTYDPTAGARQKSPWNGQGPDPAAWDATRAIMRAEFERVAQEKADEEARLNAMSTEELRASLAGLRWEQD